MDNRVHSNHLKNEKSPYLLQHAGNPVDWYPWDEEAFTRAKQEDKPIFLSIGYSTCHWCHVMEKESFENDKIAEILNSNYVSIKVDREERPDIDSVYMQVCQSMTGGGGWPLTIIMTPDKKPFFSATYLPPEDKIAGQYGMRGLKTILNSISVSWSADRDKIIDAAEKVTQYFISSPPPSPGDTPGEELLHQAFRVMENNFDPEFGGIGKTGPKFPQSHNFSFLLQYYERTGNPKALEIVEATLDNIDRGGIHDHVGGGFARYSTDREWLVPHFEKMLYDQALLSRTFIEAFQVTGKERYADAARDIFDYVLRDMTSPEGAFFSAEDADSEGEEGKFYVWTKSELAKTLGEHSEKFNRIFGVTDAGNFEHNTNIIHLPAGTNAHSVLKDPEIISCLKNLYAERRKRVRPHLDDKVLTSWNGLMISSFAYGGAVLGEKKYIDAAQRAADFFIDTMFKDGKLLRRFRDGEAAIDGFLDDYSFLANGLLDLYEANFDVEYLDAAYRLADVLLKDFYDNTKGGFSFSSATSERMIFSSIEAYDGAEPSGNSIAALVLLRLGRFTGAGEFTEKAIRIFSSFSSQIKRYPPGFTQMLIALDFYLRKPLDIVIAGKKDSPDTGELAAAARRKFLPGRVLAFRPDENGFDIAKIIPITNDKVTLNDRATAYVCKDYSCREPVNSAEEMIAIASE